MSGESEEFALALRAAIAARGLSLERIRYHLTQRGHELSVATISYWQSGRSRPERATSLAALAALEEILEVSPGELAAKLPSRRRQPSATSAGPPKDAFMRSLEDAAERIGLSWQSGLQRVAVHDRVEIGEGRHNMARGVKELFVAERDGVDRYPMAYRSELPANVNLVTPVRNCHLGRSAEIAESGLVITEIILDRALRAGESVLVEHELAVTAASVADAVVERLLLRPVRSAHTEVLFHASCVPLSAERYTVVDGIDRADPVVIAGPSLHALVLDFGPGSYGLRWTW